MTGSDFNQMRRGRQSPLPKPGAFTLIELLVVIGMLAILASILLPTLARAKEKGQRTVCLANNKQLALGLLMYVSDNSDQMPWPNWGFTAVGWAYRPPLVKNNFAQQIEQLKKGLLYPHINSDRIYRCPMDQTNRPAWRLRDQKATSYVMNGSVCAYGRMDENSTPNTISFSRFSPDAWLFWETDERTSSYFDNAANYPDEGITLRHGSGGLVSAFGGQAFWTKPENFQKEQRRRPGRLWNNPLTSSGGPE